MTLTKHLESLGFVAGIAFPSVFHHPLYDITTLVHGDDYVSAGPAHALSWLQRELEAKFEVKTQRVGEGHQCVGEGKVLNRIVRATELGWELEADPRHGELVREQLGIGANAKSVTTPYIDVKDEELLNDDEPELSTEQVSAYRGIAARLNYLGFDRPDLQFSVKEACREMAKPTQRSWERLRRIGRYLAHRPRLVWRYPMQMVAPELIVYTDANWAGCKRSRKSTSGGCIFRGAHCIKAWSKTQAVIAKSSAESELLGIIRGSCEGLGVQSLARDLGEDVKIQVYMDATAAAGIVERRGISRVRHLDTDILWIQEAQARRLLPLKKVPGTRNPADLMTKGLSSERIGICIDMMELVFLEGRASAAAGLHALDRSRGAHGGGCTRTDEFSRVERRSVCHKSERESMSEGELVREPVGDSWDMRGVHGVWRRRHATWRRALFTPYHVKKGPGKHVGLEALRITRGRFLDGCEFELVDRWREAKNSHLDLGAPWKGTTVFQEVEASL